ncbi:hypothetical protein ACFQZX_18125 [Mucilaginibacter litoreus]|uniref:YhhN-like protein n=1 Tax=Mucilaginibacter litoreus TaxID=1048221 RepID=A0ABW3AXA3_9SPHI
MLFYFTINTIVELLCLIMAIGCLYRQPDTVWKNMIFFMLVIVVAEFTGRHVKRIYLQDVQHNLSNAWVYNVLLIAQALFFSVQFKYLIGKHKAATYVIGCGLALIAVLYGFELHKHGFYVFNNDTYTVLLVMLICYSLYYYYLLLKDEDYIELKTSAGFWWVTGILFFCFGTIISTLFRDKLSAILVTSHNPLTYYIYNALNVILYGCWSYSFLCKRWQTPILKSSY